MPKTILITGYLLFLITGKVASQNAWTIYNTSNSGLPFDAVNCIAFEQSGLKWIGTEFGLASFDDITWTIYNTSNSGLPDNAIRSLKIDAFNNKWIGTFLGGLAKFDGTSWTVFNTANSSLPDNFIKTIELDTVGNKWIGTIQGLVKYDDVTFTVFDFSNSPFELSDNIARIHIDSNNIFRIGTLNGGFIKIIDTVWTVYTIPNGSGIPDNTQLDVGLDANGVEWLATPANGLVAHPGGNTWLKYTPFTSTMPSSATTSLEILKNPDRIWIGTYDKGIVRKSGLVFDHFDNSNSPFPDVHASCVESDANGLLWIGTQSGGLARLDESILNSVVEPIQNIAMVYPTLVKEEVNIQFTLNNINSIMLLDVHGKESNIHFVQLNALKWRANLSTLPVGVYFVRVTAHDGTSHIKKIIRIISN